MPRKKQEIDPSVTSDDIARNIADLEAIVHWFSDQKTVDLAKGIEQFRRGADLITGLKKQMGEIENEFREIKKGIDE